MGYLESIALMKYPPASSSTGFPRTPGFNCARGDSAVREGVVRPAGSQDASERAGATPRRTLRCFVIIRFPYCKYSRPCPKKEKALADGRQSQFPSSLLLVRIKN